MTGGVPEWRRSPGMKIDTHVLEHAFERNGGRPWAEWWDTNPVKDWSQAELDALTDEHSLKTVLAVEANAEGKRKS